MTDPLGEFIADTMLTRGGTAAYEPGAPYHRDTDCTVYAGDCLDVLKRLPDNSVDAVCTDPPYGIGFMGQQWDQPGPYGSQRSKGPQASLNQLGRRHTNNDRERGGAMVAGEYDRSLPAMHNFQNWCTAWAAECLRVLKPGGHMLAFGGTRTFHRLACAIEDAGFEIRDSIAWLYGSGFPKSLDVSKAIDQAAGAERRVVGKKTGRTATPVTDMRGGNYGNGRSGRIDTSAITAPATGAAKQWHGWGTALKPAYEPIIVARKPLTGTVAANVLAWGTGALNIDACRVDSGPVFIRGGGAKYDGDGNKTFLPSGEVNEWRTGRWPPNVVLDPAAAAELDRQSGIFKGQIGMKADTPVQFGVGHERTAQSFTRGVTDEGGASRFFPTFNQEQPCTATPTTDASTNNATDADVGPKSMTPSTPAAGASITMPPITQTFRYTAKAPGTERPTADGVNHPTVKPVSLIRWCIKLICPPGGTVLDPFAGSGTTGEAAILEHKHAILIEREPTYLPLIVARLTKPMEVGFDFEENA